MKHRFLILMLPILIFTACNTPHKHPLRVSKINPRYFTNGNGKAVYLTGFHTWNNLLDMTSGDSVGVFDYKAYLDSLTKYDLNFFRLWTWELIDRNTEAEHDRNARIFEVDPHPWLRTGPGTATDGKPKFDLTKFNPDYFNRLRNRVEMARDKGIYVSIMLFEGYGIQFTPGGYKNHPFYPDNNINDLGLSPDENHRLEIHEMINKKVLAIQENYVRKVIETVNDLDNVLYEISNENHPASTEWQYHMIRFIKDYEKKLGVRHPVGMTFQYKGGKNQTLFESPADWISPNSEGGYRDDPPSADGSKVIINDTDQLRGIGGKPGWVWESFLRGMNTLFMDPYDGKILKQDFDVNWAVSMRKNLGYTSLYARKIDLIHMVPQGNLSSSGYCLADKGKEYLVYNPGDSTVNVNLQGYPLTFDVEWFNPDSGNKIEKGSVKGGTDTPFVPPFHASFSVLYLKAQ